MKNNRKRPCDWHSRYILLSVIMILSMFVMSGCMYPNSDGQQLKVSYRDSVERIQNAIDHFQKEQGILPILNAGESTPRYEKFRVDLDQLQKKGYIDEIPSTAFEKGGSVYYLILNEETDPIVKVMDLVTVQKVNDVQRYVNGYKASHNGNLPKGSELHPGTSIYYVDLDRLGQPNLQLRSVYSGQDIPFIMNENGTVYADYSFDIMQAIDRESIQPKENEDLRIYLVNASYFVPVKSLPYHWMNKEPVPVNE
ncbi:hypothetical protein PASE110613_01455 [Paenibacillus sediminis]|uniref:Lipoprotein n=1 Tax=Paenibacillus sediminis TaxID=664909 RepID=A0ABS4GZP7_9BACL|nr:hypothetical protein [Paenibacillus sediminis]MBP1935750.1 hypothetical protein [Paenibacillus sediminis]